MRMPRFRVRTLMIAVAVVAVLTWGGIEGSRLYRLSRHYQNRAAQLAFMEESARDGIAFCAVEASKWEHGAAKIRKGEPAGHEQLDSEVQRILCRYEEEKKLFSYAATKKTEALERYASIWDRGALGFRRAEQAGKSVAIYRSQMRLKYEHAARYPWLAVEPDPPMPE